MVMLSYCFFFSSRRRHTRLQGDWSSDVCSSDLSPFTTSGSARRILVYTTFMESPQGNLLARERPLSSRARRSEERRVGKGVDLGGRRIIKKKNKKMGQCAIAALRISRRSYHDTC